MKQLYPLRGIVTVLNTPFCNDNTIDYNALKKNVTEALRAGVAGFLVPAMASEVHKLSTAERLKMFEAVFEIAGDRVPVFAGAGDSDIGRSRKLLKEYLDLGCRHVLLQIPFSSEAQFRNHFMRLAELEPEVIMLQDWDSSGYGLSDELILDLFENVDAFRCLKVEIVPAGVKYSRILKLTQGRLNVSGGWAVLQMIEGLKRGVHAFMPTGMHYIYVNIYRFFEAGNHDEAEKLFLKLLPVLAFSNQHLDISIHFFKRLLYKQGIYPTFNVREPILPFDSLHQELADKLINKVIDIENDLR
jgi:dihydrodipicolinate synthase/N-acetylneuraminate lyase